MTKVPKPILLPKHKNDKIVHIKMTQSQLNSLKYASKKLEMSMSALVRYSITEFISNHLWYNIHKLNPNLISQERRKLMRQINTRPRNDKKVFKRTAANTKKVNVRPKAMRGGTRL